MFDELIAPITTISCHVRGRMSVTRKLAFYKLTRPKNKFGETTKGGWDLCALRSQLTFGPLGGGGFGRAVRGVESSRNVLCRGAGSSAVSRDRDAGLALAAPYLQWAS
jgi:hypothetical protein